MCETGDRAEITAVEALPGGSLEWKGEVLPLEPLDELSVLTVCDNVTGHPACRTRARRNGSRWPR